jgi:hypothetical protein
MKMIQRTPLPSGPHRRLPVRLHRHRHHRHAREPRCQLGHHRRLGPCHSAITTTWVHASRPLPPHRPPSRHHRWVHAARPSPPSGPRLPDCLHLQQFGKSSPSLFPSPSVNSVLLCLDVCLYDYASKLIMLRNLIVQMPMIIFMFLLI